jgi:group I intron endonuclease
MSTEDRVYEIYCVTNAVNNKKYVGQTCVGLKRRWSKHTWMALVRNGNTRFYAAIRKHGKEAFRLSILQTCVGLSASDQAEKFWIIELNTMNTTYGYNSSEGGEGRLGCRQSPEAIAKAATSKRGKQLTTRRLRTQEQDRPIVEAFKAGMSRGQIVTELGFTPAKVQKALTRWKERVDPSLRVGPDHQYEQHGTKSKKRADELNRPMIDALLVGKSRRQVMEEFGVNYARVKQVIQRHRKRCIEEGLDVPSVLFDKTGDIIAAVDARDAPVVELFKQGLKRGEIATKLGITYAAVKQALVRHRRRTWSVDGV